MPVQIIESTDSISNLIQFQTSAIYEMIVSLHVLLQPGRQTERATDIRAHLSDSFLQELEDLYKPYFNGMFFFELPIDYDDYDDVPGFIQYVRKMDPVTFIYYLIGRILTLEEIAQTNLEPQALTVALQNSPHDASCLCYDISLDPILDDVPALQHRLTDLWQQYWDDFFVDQIALLRPYWQNAIDDKLAILHRSGGMGVFEHITGKSDLPPPLPEDHPITEVVFIPFYQLPWAAYVFYGHGNITVLFDSERTEAHLANVEHNKVLALGVLKALGDGSRLDILRLVAHYGELIHGKKIAAQLKLSAPTVSRHLTQLKEAGLITEETTDNRTITYRLQESTITELPERLLDFLLR